MGNRDSGYDSSLVSLVFGVLSGMVCLFLKSMESDENRNNKDTVVPEHVAQRYRVSDNLYIDMVKSKKCVTYVPRKKKKKKKNRRRRGTTIIIRLNNY